MTQPLAELPCNPYSSGLASDDISLECSIIGPKLRDNSTVTIEWFRLLDSMNGFENLCSLSAQSPHLVEVETRPVPISSDMQKVRSLLTIKDVIPNDVEGSYWCVVSVTQGINGPSINNVFKSEGSTPTMVFSPRQYNGTESCEANIIHTSLSDEHMCVSFQTIPNALVEEEEPPTDTPTNSSSSTRAGRGPRGPTSTIDSLGEVRGNILFTTTMVVALSVIGVVLCVVIHVLLAMVSCLLVRSRRKNARKDTQGSSIEGETAILISIV